MCTHCCIKEGATHTSGSYVLNFLFIMWRVHRDAGESTIKRENPTGIGMVGQSVDYTMQTELNNYGSTVISCESPHGVK